MPDPSCENQPNDRRGAQHGRRRLLLWALLLCCLLGLLYARPDLRRPAVDYGRHIAQRVVFDVVGLSPRAVYAWRLRLAGLSDRPLVRAWRAAPNQAQQQATAIGRAVSTTLNLPARDIAARVFTTQLKQGQALQWRLQRDEDSETPQAPGRLYATLERRTDNGWRHRQVLSADGRRHVYVADAGGRYRLLFQPELAAGFHGALAVSKGGSLAFPVIGGHPYDIGGGFGAPRDGGTRQHHGVDIFAARDTPVRAVTDGRVRTGNSGLGGQHIWLSTRLFGSSRFYYAHLNRFAVESGSDVRQGDVIGYVGNSGNARGGPPHLHFGIYTADGAIDPAPFIEPMPTLADLPAAN